PPRNRERFLLPIYPRSHACIVLSPYPRMAILRYDASHDHNEERAAQIRWQEQVGFARAGRGEQVAEPSTKSTKKSKASATNAKVSAAGPAGAKPSAAKPANAMPGATRASSSTKASSSTNTNDETMNMNINEEPVNMNMNKEPVNINTSNEGSKVQDKEVMEMFRKFQEAQAAAEEAASEVDCCSEASTSTNALATPLPFNIFDDRPSFDFGISDFSNIFYDKPSNIFGLRESPDIFDDKPSFNFATTASEELVLLDSQGVEVSVLATYAIPDKDRMPTFEGEVDFFRDWTQEQLDEEQHAPVNDRKAARLRLRRKRFDFVGGPGYRVYLARRESRLTEDGDDFLPRKRMHTTQDLANMRAKWKVRRERPLRERALRRCLRERAVKYGKGGDAYKARKGEREVNKVEEEAGEKGWKVLLRLKADGSMGDDGCQVDEIYAVGGEEQAMGDEDHPMGNVEEGKEEGDEDHPMDDGEEDEDDDPDTPRVPFRRESTPEPEGEEDWLV
ncbi:hypothetical protein EV715DRAFT_213933, partial [Schizophyllum commune]